MKLFNKIAISAVALSLLAALASCGGDTKTSTTPTTDPVTSTPTTDPVTSTEENTSMEGSIADEVMTYAQYDAAELDDEVVIQAYIQGKQSWWSNKGTFYLQDDNGGYFVYELGCTQADYNDKLTIGSRVKIKGVKGAWSGQVEILGSQAGAEAIWQTVKGQPKIYVAKEIEFTKEVMAAHANQLVKFTGLEVVSVTPPTKDGGDIYFDVKKNDLTLTFCVESYLCDATTEVYQTVLNLEAGEYVSLQGFMYTYNDPQLHTTSVSILN